MRLIIPVVLLSDRTTVANRCSESPGNWGLFFCTHSYIMQSRAIYVYKCLVIENKYIGR